MVDEQDLPFGLVFAKAAHAAICDCHATAGPPEDVAARIDRISQDVVHRVVDGQPLHHSAAALSRVADATQHDAVAAQREVDLADALYLSEAGEHQGDRVAHAQIGVLFDLVAARGAPVLTEKVQSLDIRASS
ncbi:hypothetical protein A4R29_05025 [Mesorhizobium ciceri biovar biserrulae]|nr:hypothetical protein A4R29_05025 [Mesorhizobium ciceri biovar biserrulae]